MTKNYKQTFDTNIRLIFHAFKAIQRSISLVIGPYSFAPFQTHPCQIPDSELEMGELI